MFLILLLLWLIFSGSLTLSNLLYGAAVSALVTLFCTKFMGYDSRRFYGRIRKAPRLACYLAVLAREMVRECFLVIGMIWSGRELDSMLVRFRSTLKSEGLRVLVANYILEGVYFYSGFMFFYNLGRNGRMPGSVQEIRYINRDENTHLWLFRNILLELQKEEPQLFTEANVKMIGEMIDEGVRQEIEWGHYVIGDEIEGLNKQMLSDYIRYLGNQRYESLGFGTLYPGFETEPESMRWVSQYANANLVKTDCFEARSTAYAKSSALVDDL